MNGAMEAAPSTRRTLSRPLRAASKLRFFMFFFAVTAQPAGGNRAQWVLASEWIVLALGLGWCPTVLAPEICVSNGVWLSLAGLYFLFS